MDYMQTHPLALPSFCRFASSLDRPRRRKRRAAPGAGFSASATGSSSIDGFPSACPFVSLLSTPGAVVSGPVSSRITAATGAAGGSAASTFADGAASVDDGYSESWRCLPREMRGR